jgi:mannose-6-phosphate isomerase-like protein (cupin superfamily)
MGNIDEVVKVWGDYTRTIDDWQQLVQGIEPKASGCGPIYEFAQNPIPGRPDEDFCIADMRDIDVTEPHYHPDSVTEIYFVLQGIGRVFVGQSETEVSTGSVVVMPPRTAHFTIPAGGLVLAVVNTPPFKPEDYIAVHESDLAVHFDQDFFNHVTSQAI